MGLESVMNGIPTDIDVKRLEEKWPALKMKVHDQFPYSEIERVIGVSKATNRFQTVTSIWRRKVEQDTNRIIGPMKDASGLWVLSESDKYELMRSRLRESARKCKRAIVIGARTDLAQLTAEEQAGFRHAQMTAGSVLAVAQIKKRAQLPTV